MVEKVVGYKDHFNFFQFHAKMRKFYKMKGKKISIESGSMAKGNKRGERERPCLPPRDSVK